MPIILCIWDLKTIPPLEQRAQGGTTCAYYGAIIMAGYVAKQQLLADIEAGLKSVITVTEYEKVQTVILSVLAGYDVELNESSRNATEKSKDLLNMFLDAKRVEGRADSTLARYTYILNQLFNAENVSAYDVTVYHIRDFFVKEKNRGIADSTISGYREVFNSFFGWLTNEGLISRNPCSNLGAIRQEKKVRKPYSAVEIQKMIDACTCIRDKAIILFLLNTGCRVSEMCSLKVGEIDTRSKECIVYGKGRKERTVFFNDLTAWALDEYLEERHAKPDEALFVGLNGRGMQPGGIRVMLNRIEKRSGVENVHPHRFRRTLATEMINRNVAIQDVAAILGHERIDTTMKYIYQSKERTKATYERYTA